MARGRLEHSKVLFLTLLLQLRKGKPSTNEEELAALRACSHTGQAELAHLKIIKFRLHMVVSQCKQKRVIKRKNGPQKKLVP